jgi:hypothetical protein
MPDVGHLRAAADGGHLRGGAPRAVWQTVGADPQVISARSAAERLSELGRASHLTWNPVNGEIIQMVSALRAGRSLGEPEGLGQSGPARAEDQGLPGSAEAAGPGWPATVNSEGRLCVQISVVAFAWDPFTSGPMTGLQHIMDWLESWGVQRLWPAGRPAAFPHGHAGGRSRRLWAQGGHFGASQVPSWTAAGPGAIDIGRLTGRDAAAGTGIRAPRDAAGARAEHERTERERAGLADFDDIFESPAAAAGSLTRVG